MEVSMRRLPFLLALLPPALAFALPVQQWVADYDGGGQYVDFATQALCAPSGDLILGGIIHDGAGGSDINVCEYDRSAGDILWEARLSAYDHTSDMAIDGMAWDGSGDILVAGRLLGCGTG